MNESKTNQSDQVEGPQVTNHHVESDFLREMVQPGLAGLMDGSVSTLAPIFAAAYATEDTNKAFLIGLAAASFSGGGREPLRLFLMVGFLGGFTTFSSFGLETLRLLDAGRFSVALVYIMTSNLGGLMLCWVGMRLGGGLQS